MSDLITIDAVTTSALGFWTGEVAARPRCVSPLAKIKGTGVPAAGPSVPTIEGTGLPFTAMASRWGSCTPSDGTIRVSGRLRDMGWE